MSIFNFFVHIVIAMAAALPFAHVQEQVWLAAAGSLLPDIDHPRSLLGRYNPLAAMMRHRGFAHTVAGCAVLALPFLLLQESAWQWAFFGAVTHLIADSIASGGKWRVRLW